MSFEDFLVEFKKRHPKEYGLDSRGAVAAKAPMVEPEVKAPPAPVSAPTVAAVDDWDGVEVDTEQEEYWK